MKSPICYVAGRMLERMLSTGDNVISKLRDNITQCRLYRQQQLCQQEWQQSIVGDSLLSGVRSDRLGYAFLGAYQAAIADLLWINKLNIKELYGELLGGTSPCLEPLIALCITEDVPGGHPRSIKSTLTFDDEGKYMVVEGRKSFVTMGKDADILLVLTSIAHDYADKADKKNFRMTAIRTSASGVRLVDNPALKFIPEILHSAVELKDVRLTPASVLAGCGYANFSKPFRLIEDVHVMLSASGFMMRLLALGTYLNMLPGSRDLFCELQSISHGLLGIIPDKYSKESQADSRNDDTIDIRLHGLLIQLHRCTNTIISLELKEPSNEDDNAFKLEYVNFCRDVPLLSIAGKAREARLDRAWQSFRSRVNQNL